MERPGKVELDRFFVKWENTNFLIFFWGTPNYALYNIVASHWLVEAHEILKSLNPPFTNPLSYILAFFSVNTIKSLKSYL